jgi:plasmid stabilization system protein ParE
MRRVRWSDEASERLETFLDWIAAADPAAAIRARKALHARAGSLRRIPHQGRPSRWHGWRELSVSDWKKIIVYDVRDQEIYVVTLLDPRQDLSAYVPKPENT